MLISACGVDIGVDSVEEPIIGGNIENGYAGVAFVQNDGQACSGVLLTDRHVVTMDFCITGGNTTVVFGLNVMTQPLHSSMATELARSPSSGAAPGVSVLELATPVPDEIKPLALATSPIDMTLVGQNVRIVGYGATATGGTDGGVRRSAMVPVAVVETETITWNGAPSNSCDGDAGGPMILAAGGVEKVIGFTFAGDANCAVFGIGLRSDLVFDFIDETVGGLGGDPDAGPAEPPDAGGGYGEGIDAGDGDGGATEARAAAAVARPAGARPGPPGFSS